MNKAPDVENSGRDLRDICIELHDLIAPQVSSIQEYSWTGSTENERLEFLKRAAVVRQFEAAEAIISLVDAGRGATAVMMLRAAYEELLWLEYLQQLGDIGLKLAGLLTRRELIDSYRAQKDFLGMKGLRDIGFNRRLSNRIEKGLKDPSRELQILGATLGWRQGAQRPSMAFIAKQVKRDKQYHFLYHGTSRSVHFSPHELQRRVWGHHGSVSVGSSSFERYWADFALSWSYRMLVETIILTNYTDVLGEQLKTDGDKMSELLRELRPVQILTAAELEAWDEP